MTPPDAGVESVDVLEISISTRKRSPTGRATPNEYVEVVAVRSRASASISLSLNTVLSCSSVSTG